MHRPTWTDLIDIVVYAVVIALFVRFLPEVISESFVLTVLTALLLKVVLEIVLVLKKRIVARFRSAPSLLHRLGSAAMLVLVMPGSKLVVIELTALVFGDRVHLGGFWAVTALALTLTATRLGVRWAIDRLSAAATASR